MIKNHSNTWQQNMRGWTVVACGGLFYMYQFMLRVSPNIMNNELLTNFAIDSAGLGIMVGVYYWAYSAIQIPLGITMDRLGPRIFLCAAAFICAVACFIFGNTSSVLIGGFARFLMGMGSACGLIGTIKLGTIWLESRQVAKVTGLTMVFGTLGASLGGVPLEILLNNVGFERVMEILGIIGCVIGVLIYFIVNAHPPIDHHKELPDLYANEHPLKDIMRVVKTPQAWVVAIYGMLMYIPITVMGSAWGVPFLRLTTGLTELVAVSIVSTMFFGAAFGSPFFAFYSDYIKSRRIPMFIGSVLTSLIWITVFYADLSLSWLYVLFFIAGFAYTSKCLTFASICELMPLKMSGISLAFVNMIVMTTGILFHPIIGALINIHWNGEMMNDVPHYSAQDYQFALTIVPIFLVISGFVLIFMKETHPDHKLPKEYGPVFDTDVF